MERVHAAAVTALVRLFTGQRHVVPCEVASVSSAGSTPGGDDRVAHSGMRWTKSITCRRRSTLWKKACWWVSVSTGSPSSTSVRCGSRDPRPNPSTAFAPLGMLLGRKGRMAV